VLCRRVADVLQVCCMCVVGALQVCCRCVAGVLQVCCGVVQYVVVSGIIIVAQDSVPLTLL